MMNPSADDVDEELFLPILLSEQILKSIRDANTFEYECTHIGRQVHDISSKLRSAIHIVSSYDRPLRRIFAELANTLDEALALVLRCRVGFFSILHRFGSADFKKLNVLLDASLAELHWLLSVYDDSAEPIPIPSLPTIARTDPILFRVWAYIATLSKPSSSASHRADAANSLAGLADNYRNKQILLEEGALPPLLSLLTNSSFSIDARIAAASALYNLASDAEHVLLIIRECPLPIFVQVLLDSPMVLQTKVAGLVSRMVSFDVIAREQFAIANVVRPLMLLLEEPMTTVACSDANGSMSKNLTRDESPQAKLALKIACAHALWMLSKNSVANSRTITETEGLLCLAKMVEREKGELQHYCIMILREIAVMAEANEDLRRSAFRTNSPGVKLVVEQLLRIVVQQGSIAALQIAAMKAIGSLARTFAARETRVMSPLVALLGHWNPDVAAEAADALGKFVNAENYNRLQHSKAIIDFGALPPLMMLVRSGKKPLISALVVLCYLALNVPNNESLNHVLGVLEYAAGSKVSQHPLVRELLPEAICHIELYRARYQYS